MTETPSPHSSPPDASPTVETRGLEKVAEDPNASYFLLSPDQVRATAHRLHIRIDERFPASGLAHLAGTIERVADQTRTRIEELQQPIWLLRGISYLLLAATGLLLVGTLSVGIDWRGLTSRVGFTEFIGALEPSLGSAVFIGAFVVFTWTLETRAKHRRVLQAINELRSLAHVVDMHQLTKDPERARHPGPDTPSSPRRTLSVFELGRYLNYCSEMLATLSKISALYAQAFPDEKLLAAADQMETLATGLSRKIWQKLVLLEQATD